VKTAIKILFISVLTLLISTSCVVQRNVEYLQDTNTNIKSFKEAEYLDYRLKSNDELYITINSLDDASFSMFPNAGQQPAYAAAIQPYGASLLSYSIDEYGYLLLPVIGKVLVKDKTLTEVSTMLTDSLTHVLNQPLVSVKLVNRYVSVLGEVRTPGHFPIAQEKINLLDALGMAGDITDYGDRKSVLLIRNENDQNLRINVDLTKASLLADEFYNLRPNDIVYVKPLRQKFWGLRQFPFSIVISAITTSLLILNYIYRY
jgi:polysaccharide biosynthesis/export protein